MQTKMLDHDEELHGTSDSELGSSRDVRAAWLNLGQLSLQGGCCLLDRALPLAFGALPLAFCC